MFYGLVRIRRPIVIKSHFRFRIFAQIFNRCRRSFRQTKDENLIFCQITDPYMLEHIDLKENLIVNLENPDKLAT